MQNSNDISQNIENNQSQPQNNNNNNNSQIQQTPQAIPAEFAAILGVKGLDQLILKNLDPISTVNLSSVAMATFKAVEKTVEENESSYDELVKIAEEQKNKIERERKDNFLKQETKKLLKDTDQKEEMQRTFMDVAIDKKVSSNREKDNKVNKINEIMGTYGIASLIVCMMYIFGVIGLTIAGVIKESSTGSFALGGYSLFGAAAVMGGILLCACRYKFHKQHELLETEIDTMLDGVYESLEDEKQNILQQVMQVSVPEELNVVLKSVDKSKIRQKSVPQNSNNNNNVEQQSLLSEQQESSTSNSFMFDSYRLRTSSVSDNSDFVIEMDDLMKDKKISEESKTPTFGYSSSDSE